MQAQADQQENWTRVSLNDGSQLPDIDVKALNSYGAFLGGGGFGRVYKYQRDGVTLAVKDIVYRRQSTSTASNDKILRESKIHSGLCHPNVIALHYTSEQPGRLLLVMEYADGGALSKVLKERHPLLHISTLIDWAIQIANGMCYLHEQRVVHRDLKPDNVLLKESATYQGQNTIKICDFGFARDGHQQTTTMSNFKGTKGYMAPEVISDPHLFSKHSDVWSYGVTLWQLLTGKNVYENIGLLTMYEVNKSDLPAYQLLVQLLQKCWSYFREERPTFSDIVQDLMEVGNKILVDDVTLFQGFGKWFSDHTAPMKPLFHAALADFQPKVKCRDICMTNDGHFLIAAAASGLFEFSESGLQLCHWLPPGQNFMVLLVEAIHDQRAVVGMRGCLKVLLRHVVEATGDTEMTEVGQFHLPQLNMHPSTLAVYGDVIAFCQMFSEGVRLISFSCGSDLTSSAPKFEYEVKSVAITDQLIVAVSSHQLKLPSDMFANVVEGRSRSGDQKRHDWLYEVRDSDEVTDVCADDRFVFIALKRNDKRMVTALSALHGRELLSNSFVCDAIPLLPFKLTLGGEEQRTVLVVLSNLSTVTNDEAVWKVTVHQQVLN